MTTTTLEFTADELVILRLAIRAYEKNAIHQKDMAPYSEQGTRNFWDRKAQTACDLTKRVENAQIAVMKKAARARHEAAKAA
jgi:hypothetical protein